MVFAYCDPVVSLLVCTESDFSELNRFFARGRPLVPGPFVEKTV